MIIRHLLNLLRSLSPFRYTATKCGHRTKRTGFVSAFGRTIATGMPKNGSGSVDYCLDCIGAMAIRCAWCGEPIFIGDPVTLFTPPSGFQIPDYAAVHTKEPLRLVGCLRSRCADTGADRAGYWIPDDDGKGRVQRVQTAYEAILNGGRSSAVIIDDTHNVAEAMNPTLVPLKGGRAK